MGATSAARKSGRRPRGVSGGRLGILLRISPWIGAATFIVVGGAAVCVSCGGGWLLAPDAREAASLVPVTSAPPGAWSGMRSSEINPCTLVGAGVDGAPGRHFSFLKASSRDFSHASARGSCVLRVKTQAPDGADDDDVYVVFLLGDVIFGEHTLVASEGSWLWIVLCRRGK